MPTNVVKTKEDEKLWRKAKAIVRKEYGSIERNKKWGVVMSIFEKMKHGHEKTGSINKWLGFRDEIEKKSSINKDEINWEKLMLLGALTGATIGTMKGITEKFLESRLSKIIPNNNVKWGISRGLTSASAGVAYPVVTATGLSSKNQKKKKK